MEYYSAIKRNEILIHSAAWISRENIMLSERSQTQNVTYYVIYLYELSRIGKSTETERRLMVARGWGRGTRE